MLSRRTLRMPAPTDLTVAGGEATSPESRTPEGQARRALRQHHPLPRRRRRRKSEVGPPRHADGDGRHRRSSSGPSSSATIRPTPHWKNRDRFVLSAGHASMLLYSLLHLTGYPDMTLDELKHFRQWGSRTAGHPEYGHAAGIEVTTGPLGQGFAHARRHGARREDDGGALQYRRRLQAGRSLHLRHLLRRRSRGRDQPRGRLARRPPRPRQSHLLLRRQQHLDRRGDAALVIPRM